MGKPKPLAQYRGSLTPQQVADGMNAAAKNAKRLLDDAQLLLDAKRYPSACSLAILSIEESGKLPLLRGIAGATDEKRLKEAWKEYRNHQSKNALWIIKDLVTGGAKTLDDLRTIYDEDSPNPAVLDAVKQIGFYSDCYGDAHWSEPESVVDEAQAKETILIARILLPKHETTEREIEIWIDCVGRYWGTEEMFDGAVEFHRRMELEGLPHHSVEEVEAFFGLTHGKPIKH